MVSNASEDLPEPDRPVITINLSRGRSRSMFLRLCVRAPRIRMVSMDAGYGGEPLLYQGVSIVHRTIGQQLGFYCRQGAARRVDRTSGQYLTSAQAGRYNP